MTATSPTRAGIGAIAPSTVPLASWVELHRVPDPGHARAAWLLVDRRTRMCLGLTAAEAEACRSDGVDGVLHAPDAPSLRAELTGAGFVADTPAPASGAAHGGRWAAARRAVATLELRTEHADRLARVVYRRGVRWLFHPIAVAAQVVLAIAGAVAIGHAVFAVHTVALRVHLAQVPIVLAVSAVSILVHEMCHALVVIHGGGRVDAAGVRIYLGTPTFFVESIDAQLLSRRQRIVQAAAGPWSEWLVTSLAAIWLWSAAPPIIGAALLTRFVLLNSANVLSNLLPFVKLDGSWLLADAIHQPDLSQRAEGALRRATVATILRQPVTRRERWFAAYSTANAAVAIALLAASAWVWDQLFAGVVAALLGAGPIGWLVLAVLTVVLARPVLSAAWPRIIAGVDAATELAQALAFRRQFAWRIAAVHALSDTYPTVARLDDHQRSVLAGHITAYQPTSGDENEQMTAQVPIRHLVRTRRTTTYLAAWRVAAAQTVCGAA